SFLPLASSNFPTGSQPSTSTGFRSPPERAGDLQTVFSSCRQKNEVLLLLGELDHDTFECQVGDVRGRVHKSRMKVITPLAADVYPPQTVMDKGRRPHMTSSQVTRLFLPTEIVHQDQNEMVAGDVVTMVEPVDSDWSRGTCRGSTGFFPVNYVKVLCCCVPRSGPRCVARFDFEGEHSDELSFSEGDVIQLKELMGQDWARGQMGTSTGIFPLNFVEVIEDLPPPASRHPKTKVSLLFLFRVPQPSVEWAVALYDYAGKSKDDLSFREGDRILITQHVDADWSCGRLDGREGMFPRAFVESQQPKEAAGGSRARALFNFTAECDEELSLQIGDIITDLESIDEEWFLGDLRGTRALVPRNYVQVLG
uniref:SH3 domain-containing protein n=1 Tax=Scophthalmus maximus TaxID=52904 RepID=A0A8D3DZV9_SCOMX